MVAFSKYFYKTVTGPAKTCQEVIHHGSCIDSTIWNFTQTISGCAKFVLPLALLPIIMKIKRLNRDVFKRSAKIFVDYFLGAWLHSGFGLSFICFFRQIFGRFHYFTVLALPGSMAAVIGSTILPEPVVHTYAHGMSSVAIEISINRGDFYVLKFVRNSRLLITFIFMVVNALLMHGLRENTDGGFYWLIQPTKNHFDNNEEIDAEQIGITKGKTCAHEENCYTHTFQGIKNFAKFGLGLEIARNLIYNYTILLKNPVSGLSVLFQRLNWNLIGFLAAYKGIYLASNCISTRFNHKNDSQRETKQHLYASAITGLSFYLYPNLSILSHTIVTTIELYWKLNKTTIKNRFKWLPIDIVSFNSIFYSVCSGYLLHIRAFTPWLAPSILKKLMSLTTNYKDEDIYTKYHRYLFGLTPQFYL